MPWFSGRCESAVRLVGKTALVTGCNTGIGKETAFDFYKRGARVLMACRNVRRAEEAKANLEKRCEGNLEVGTLVVLKLDLMSLKSVRECAQQVLNTEPQLNVLVNNAGVMMCPQGLTEDGFEIQIGTNHFGHFLLTMLLLPRIRSSTPARIVTVSSRAHERYGIDFEDINYKNRPYRSIEAYSQSKLANVLFSRELAAKLKEHNIENVNTFCLHPGVIKTELGRHFNETLFPGSRWLFSTIAGPFIKSPELGAQTQIYCSVDEKCANESGLYYSDCVAVKPDVKALNNEYAKKLWDISTELVNLGDFDPFMAVDPGVKAN